MIKHISIFIYCAITLPTMNAMHCVRYQNKLLIHSYTRLLSTQKQLCGQKEVCKYNSREVNSCQNKLERACAMACQSLYVELVNQYSPWRNHDVGLETAYKIAGCEYNQEQLDKYTAYIQKKLLSRKKDH